MKYLVLAALLLSSPAIAEDAPTSPPAAAPLPVGTTTTPSTFRFDMDAQDLALLNTCVVELPKRLADPFIAKLQAQYQAQVKK